MYTDLLCSEEEGGSYIEIATGLAILGASRHPKLKIIKDSQRSTMNQYCLNNRSLMSMEFELLSKSDISAIIKAFSVKNHVNITCIAFMDARV